jgi:hypothetical protein
MAENYGNANVFLRPTNRKHFLLPGQFGLAASDYMYGNQRPEFYQCTCQAWQDHAIVTNIEDCTQRSLMLSECKVHVHIDDSNSLMHSR